MYEAILSGLAGLTDGVQFLFTLGGLKNVVMLAIAGVLIYLGVKKDVEPLLLVPIGFGCLLANIPLGELMVQGIDPGARQVFDATGTPDAARELVKTDTGFLRTIYNMGIANELFPLLIFIGIGAMTDFAPLLENPKILLFGAAGQCGIFLTLLLALALGFPHLEAMAIAIIGACDGPTAIYVASQYAPELLGPISVAAYSYMALVPIIQPPIMRALTTDKERDRRACRRSSATSCRRPPRLIFPIVVTIVTGLIAPKGLPLMGSIMLGNFMRESGAVARLTKASENEIANIATLVPRHRHRRHHAGGGVPQGHDAGDLRARLRRHLPRHRGRRLLRQDHVRAVGRQDQSADRRRRHLGLSDGGPRGAGRKARNTTSRISC